MSVDEALVGALLPIFRKGADGKGALGLRASECRALLAALERAARVEKENHWLRELAEVQDSLIAAYRIGIGGSRKAGVAIDLFRKAQERLTALGTTPGKTASVAPLDIRRIVDDWWAKWSSEAGPPEELRLDLIHRLEVALGTTPGEVGEGELDTIIAELEQIQAEVRLLLVLAPVSSTGDETEAQLAFRYRTKLHGDSTGYGRSVFPSIYAALAATPGEELP